MFKQQQDRFQEFMNQQQQNMMNMMKQQQEMLTSKDNLIDRVLKENSSEKEKTTKELIESLNKQQDKRIKCPKWSKNEEFESFAKQLQYWNKCQNTKGKYLELLESLEDSEREPEKRRIELEVQNEELNPDDEDIITKIVEKLHKWFGKPEIDKEFLSWNEVISMKRKDNESIGEFILRYETAEAKLRCSATALPPLLLAIHLIQSLNVDEAERRLIVSNIKFENNNEVYEQVKQSIRLHKSSLVEDKKEKAHPEESSEDTFYGEDRNSKHKYFF